MPSKRVRTRLLDGHTETDTRVTLRTCERHTSLVAAGGDEQSASGAVGCGAAGCFGLALGDAMRSCRGLSGFLELTLLFELTLLRAWLRGVEGSLLGALLRGAFLVRPPSSAAAFLFFAAFAASRAFLRLIYSIIAASYIFMSASLCCLRRVVHLQWLLWLPGQVGLLGRRLGHRAIASSSHVENLRFCAGVAGCLGIHLTEALLVNCKGFIHAPLWCAAFGIWT